MADPARLALDEHPGPPGSAGGSALTIDESLTAAQRTRMTELLGAEPKQATTGTAKARETIDHAVLRSPEFFPR